MKTKANQITIEHNGATLTISAETALKNFIESMGHAPSASSASTPKIGEQWCGGIYAGIAAGENGEPDAHVILLDAAPKEMNWKDAMEYAESLGDGARLPTRTESALVYANLRDRFENKGWHWTSTQYSSHDAFGQYFDGGYQDFLGKGLSTLVRPLRRKI